MDIPTSLCPCLQALPLSCVWPQNSYREKLQSFPGLFSNSVSQITELQQDNKTYQVPALLVKTSVGGWGVDLGGKMLGRAERGDLSCILSLHRNAEQSESVIPALGKRFPGAHWSTGLENQ